eukprot:m51a1_g9966 hypothetical protein (225) ;mRNA; f:88328-89562
MEREPTAGTKRQVAVEDAPWTFHTHPITFDADDLPTSYSNLIGNEDMVAAVEDDARNYGRVSNANGSMVFDVLCCPMGILVYSAGQKALEEWRSLEPSATTFEGVELHNSRFEQRLGSARYDGTGSGQFSVIKASFQFLGYQQWFEPESPQYAAQKKLARTAEERSWLGREDQMRWFMSPQFMALDLSKEELLLQYLSFVEGLGFKVQFFNWGPLSEDITFTWC